ncbi:hypothetical protein Tco_1265551, partial [Tanacetum coccineum]
SKTPSTKDTSSSSIDYIPKSPTSSTSLSPNGYLNPPTSLPPRVSPPPPTQKNASMDITLTLSPITPLDVQFDTPSPIFDHPIPYNLFEAHEDSYQVEEPIFVQDSNYAKHDDAEFDNTNMSMDQGEDFSKTDEQPNDEDVPKYDWYKKSKSNTSADPE